MDNKLSVLQTVFGFEQFKPNQEEIIDAILDFDNNGVLVVMPTGGGKSLLYQIPSIMMENICIVVSPLISLMKDQVDALKNINVDADVINSVMKKSEQKTIYTKLQNNLIKILYVSPERLNDEIFLNFIDEKKIDIIAIDEAHCISSWGHDFRPAYRNIKPFIDRIKPKQIIAVTATATPTVQQDICKQLGIDNAKKFVRGFFRNNLIVQINYQPQHKYMCVAQDVQKLYLKGHKTGIVYCNTKKSTEEITTILVGIGVPALYYHAGMSQNERKNAQDLWALKGGIMVATTAFGMGIDRPDVRFVVNADMPGTIEEFYQMIGRAGRDGKKALCKMYFNDKDFAIHRFLIDLSFPPKNDFMKFWQWMNYYAKKNKIITISKDKMSEMSGVKETFIPGCISLLKRNGIITSSNRSQYEVVKTYDNYMDLEYNETEYDSKRNCRLMNLHNIIKFSKNTNCCRMESIMKYFGDTSIKPCGKCDFCKK